MPWLFLAALLLVLWQAPFFSLIYRQTGIHIFLQTAFQAETLPPNQPWSGQVTADTQLKTATAYLEQANSQPVPPQKSPDASRTLGVATLMAGDPAKGQQLLSHRLDITPDDILARFFLCETHRRLGDTAATIEQWEAAGAQKPLMILAGELIEQEAQVEALEALKALMRLNTRDTQPRWLAAQILDQQGDLAGALALFQDIVRLNPDSEAAHRRVADILIEQGRIEQALKAYQEVMDLFPERATGYRLAGQLLFEQGDYQKAIQFFNQSLERDPENPHLIFQMLGESYAALGLWSEATKAYEQAIRERPDHHPSYVLMGEARCQMGLPEDAYFYFQQAIALGSQAVQARQAIEHITHQGTCPP